MPNLIQCRISIKPAPDNLRDLLGPDGIDFQVLLPVSGVDREARRDAWGCPGNASTPTVEYRDGGVILAFDAPWSPPTTWIGALTGHLHARNPGVRLTYAVCDYASRTGAMAHFRSGAWSSHPVSRLGDFMSTHGFQAYA